ncbi:hypothetical protein RRG08_021102 [Elysia crispata]|uniref:Uncharacterized protein n=1 Tax=Elysia crispata TaxID=231223 RepID=A0AAE0Z5J0_9GAST|nr:hypothetical protein RRG08_021102 [Elysia crispata]
MSRETTLNSNKSTMDHFLQEIVSSLDQYIDLLAPSSPLHVRVVLETMSLMLTISWTPRTGRDVGEYHDVESSVDRDNKVRAINACTLVASVRASRNSPPENSMTFTVL